VVDATGGEPTIVAQRFDRQPGAPVWSPDGSRLLFVAADRTTTQLYTVAASGGTPAAITNIAGVIAGASFSRDGSLVAFTQSDVQHPADVYVGRVGAPVRAERRTDETDRERLSRDRDRCERQLHRDLRAESHERRPRDDQQRVREESGPREDREPEGGCLGSHRLPRSACSPVAITPDALGDAWREGKLHGALRSSINGQELGRPDAGLEMQFDFGRLIAHAARTRPLAAGTIVGAGTVLTPAHYRDAERAGARFVVSPGATPALLEAAAAARVPFLPGAASASEVMRLLDQGYRCLKFFPAEPAGGIAWLKALASPLPEAGFCPTGGIDAARAERYLTLPNVLCVGGSWVAPGDAVAAGDWPKITGLARAAAALRGPA